MRVGCIGNQETFFKKCTILEENLCEKGDGKCNFFCTREQAIAGRKKTEGLLAKKGICPIVRRAVVDGLEIEIQSTSTIKK